MHGAWHQGLTEKRSHFLCWECSRFGTIKVTRNGHETEWYCSEGHEAKAETRYLAENRKAQRKANVQTIIGEIP